MSTNTQSHFEYVYLCVERHPDQLIVAAFTTEEAAEDFCNAPCNSYQGRKLYEVGCWSLNDFRACED